jgi:ATP-dependent Clp protease ATP-binding subunit ClpB
LLDEIEKAHPDVFNILLQVLEDGRLTDNKGRLVNFKNSIIIMTSNMGSHIIRENFSKVTEENLFGIIESTKIEVMELLRQTIRPEFLNRIDDIIMFRPLGRKQVRNIVKIQINELEKLLATNGIQIDVSDLAIDWLAAHGFEPEYGARPLKRVIQKEIINRLSKEILAGKVNKDDKIHIDTDAITGGIRFENTANQVSSL